MTALLKYDVACRAVAEAKTMEDVMALRNKAEAVKHFARMSKDRQMEVDAAEIRIRSERRLGEMLIDLKQKGLMETKRGRGKKDRSNGKFYLRDLGVDHKLSWRGQKIAAEAADLFERRLSAWRAFSLKDSGRVTAGISEDFRVVGRSKVSENRPLLDGVDIRDWPLAKLRRHIEAAQAVLDWCGSADETEAVGSLIGDDRLRSLLNGASK